MAKEEVLEAVVEEPTNTEEYEDDPDKYGNCPCYICQSGDY